MGFDVDQTADDQAVALARGVASRAIRRDDLLSVAVRAEEALSLGRRESVTSGLVNPGDDPFQRALDNHLAGAQGDGASAIPTARANHLKNAASLEILRALVDDPTSRSQKVRAAVGLLEQAVFEVRKAGTSRDRTSEVMIKYQFAHALRLSGELPDAITEAQRTDEFFHGSGAEPHRGHFNFETAAGLFESELGSQIAHAIGEDESFWSCTYALSWPTRNRFELAMALAALWSGKWADAVRRLEKSANILQAAADQNESSAREALWAGSSHSLAQSVSTWLTIADSRTIRSAQHLHLETQAIEALCRVVGLLNDLTDRWGSVLRSSNPLTKVLRILYGDLASICSRLNSPESGRVGLAISLATKATGLARLIRANESQLPAKARALVAEINDIEAQPATRKQRATQLAEIHAELRTAIAPMFAQMVLPTSDTKGSGKIHELVASINAVEVAAATGAIDPMQRSDRLAGLRVKLRSAIGPVLTQLLVPGEGMTRSANVYRLVAAINEFKIDAPIDGPIARQRSDRLTALHADLNKAIAPVSAQTVLPTVEMTYRTIELLRGRVAIDFVKLPDIDQRDRWYRTFIGPDGSPTFEQFKLGAHYEQFRSELRHRFEDETAVHRRVWGGLSRELLPPSLIQLLLLASDESDEARSQAQTLMICPHGEELADIPWPALILEPRGTRMVHRAAATLIPSLSCLTGILPEPPIRDALVRLVGPDEDGVPIDGEAGAWGVDVDRFRGTVMQCPIGQSGQATAVGTSLLGRLDRGLDGIDLVHVAAHGSKFDLGQGSGLGKERLTAAAALAVRWPESVLLISCHVAFLENVADDEPLGLPVALLANGARSIVGGIHAVQSTATAVIGAQTVANMRNGQTLLQALRTAQLIFADRPAHEWALLATYST